MNSYQQLSTENTSVIITAGVKNGLVQGLDIDGYPVPDQVCSKFTNSLPEGHGLTLFIQCVSICTPASALDGSCTAISSLCTSGSDTEIQQCANCVIPIEPSLVSVFEPLRQGKYSIQFILRGLTHGIIWAQFRFQRPLQQQPSVSYLPTDNNHPSHFTTSYQLSSDTFDVCATANKYWEWCGAADRPIAAWEYWLCNRYQFAAKATVISTEMGDFLSFSYPNFLNCSVSFSASLTHFSGIPQERSFIRVLLLYIPVEQTLPFGSQTSRYIVLVVLIRLGQRSASPIALTFRIITNIACISLA